MSGLVSRLADESCAAAERLTSLSLQMLLLFSRVFFFNCYFHLLVDLTFCAIQ